MKSFKTKYAVQIKILLINIRQEYFTNTTLHIILQFEPLHFIFVQVYFR